MTCDALRLVIAEAFINSDIYFKLTNLYNVAVIAQLGER